MAAARQPAGLAPIKEAWPAPRRRPFVRAFSCAPGAARKEQVTNLKPTTPHARTSPHQACTAAPAPLERKADPKPNPPVRRRPSLPSLPSLRRLRVTITLRGPRSRPPPSWLPARLRWRVPPPPRPPEPPAFPRRPASRASDELEATLSERHAATMYHFREASASMAGVDLPTFLLLTELQRRDITCARTATLSRPACPAPPRRAEGEPPPPPPIWPLVALPRCRRRPEDYDVLSALNSTPTPRRLTLEQLDAHAPSSSFSKEHAPQAPTPRCSICLEPCTEGEVVRRLPCAHLFHAACIDEWLTQGADLCPECHRAVAPEEETSGADVLR